MKPDLKIATPDDVKILMTNAVWLRVSEVLELHSFIDFPAVQAWVKLAITTVQTLSMSGSRTCSTAG